MGTLLNWLDPLLKVLRAHTELGTLGQWVAAIVTFSAVLVALFPLRDWIIGWLRRPLLVVDASIRCDKFPYIIQKTGQLVYYAYIYRFWIQNQGKSRATDVQVFAAKLFKATAPGKYRPVSEFLPSNLVWAHVGTPFTSGISPKMGEFCDLGRIADPGNRPQDDYRPNVAPTKTIFKLLQVVQPTTLTHLLEPGRYRLEIHIAAANSKPVIRTVEFTHGDWSNDEQTMGQLTPMKIVK